MPVNKNNTVKTDNSVYRQSESLLSHAEEIIPGGTQTFSKSKTQYPKGVSPFYASSARGCKLIDIDGNEYIDFVNALCAVTLGYQDPDVDSAVRLQMNSGGVFTLPHPIEVEVAEQLCQMIPCAEMVRFGKNGSDATAGAVRLARAYTGRDHIAACGYHGWQDWFIGTTARNLGVPKGISELTHTFNYNDINSLEKIFDAYPNSIAGVIMEPMNVSYPESGFLESVQKLCVNNKSLFILDEIITGFRYSRGGAQELFGVVPDLATFGKGLANGYPLSAIVGRADVMSVMQDAFFSFTMGSEALSLAAANATLKKIQKDPVIERIYELGLYLISEVQRLILKHNLSDIFNISGHPSWSFLTISDFAPYSSWEIKTFFYQEMFLRKILTLGTHNLSYSHSEQDVDRLIYVYDEVFPLLHQAILKETLLDDINCDPLTPLFKVR